MDNKETYKDVCKWFKLPPRLNDNSLNNNSEKIDVSFLENMLNEIESNIRTNITFALLNPEE